MEMHSTNKIPEVIQEAARKYSLGTMEYVGQIGSATVYVETHETDENGLAIPTGLPCYIVLKDGKTKLVSGLEALDLLGHFD